MKKISLILLIFFIGNAVSKAQTNVSVFEVNKALGRGVNMGNMFEAPSEGEWGNPFKDDYFKKISDLGFSHVRIPIRWDVPARALQTSPFTINNVFLQRIKTVIDLAIANKLYVVFNMHHHEGIFANPNDEKAKFLAQWAQIAQFFKGYDQKLIFEIMNEPHDKLTPALWNVFFKDALSEIRKTNPTRAVVMGLANYGGLGGLPELKLPADKNIIVSVHYYNPFNFTHQGAEWIGAEAQNWLGTKWEDLDLERKQIQSEFDPLITFAKINDAPIHIGEFGAYGKADIDSRAKWSTFLARWFESKGWSWAYWEWSAGFGIFDPTTGQMNTKLADALLKNPLTEPKKQNTKLVYQSSFATGNDGWTIAIQPGSEATLTRANNNLNIDVKTSVKDGWHVQLTKNNFEITNKKRYLVTVKAAATLPDAVTCYVAKASAPYNSYSGFPSFSFSAEEKEFSYTFLMTEPTDKAARISFDMGNTISKITISSVKIEEVVEQVITEPVLAIEDKINETIKISPNPIVDTINLEHDKRVNRIEIYNSQGKQFFNKKSSNTTKTQLILTGFPSGLYFVNFYINNKIYSRKIIKQ
jgi:endoglucanase